MPAVPLFFMDANTTLVCAVAIIAAAALGALFILTRRI